MIQGFSNFKIEIVNDNLRKSSPNDKEHERLIKQMKKQNYFRKILLNDNIFFIPKILNEGKNFFTMEFIKNSINIIDFLLIANQNSIDFLIENLIRFIDMNIQKSNFLDINQDFQNKLNDVLGKIDNYPKEINQLKEIKLGLIPVGDCHGDLTLSNILIQYQKIYLIDFLDNFIDTPMQDICKIRQDTKYFWSLNLYSETIDKNKVKINLMYLDKKIDDYFLRYKFYNDYKYFQALNLLRIVPYSKNQEINKKIFNNVLEIIQ